MYVCILLTWGAPSLCWVLPWMMIIWDALVKKQHKQPAAAAMMMMVVVFAQDHQPAFTTTVLTVLKGSMKVDWIPSILQRETHTHICMWLLLMAFWIACCSRPLFLMLPGCLPSFLELPLPLPLPLPLMKCEREYKKRRMVSLELKVLWVPVCLWWHLRAQCRPVGKWMGIPLRLKGIFCSE